MKSRKKPLANDDVMAAIRELGRQGGKQRAKNLTAQQRRKIARNAAAARWAKRKI